MKRYAQRCPVARALDVLGDRWTLLIVRELLLGPKRYTDLAEALPGVGTNILASRLTDLGNAGVITKRTLPPPTPVAVYELTDAGEALAPIVSEFRRWGQQFAPPPKADDAVRPAWVLQSAATRGPALEAGRSCELQVGRELFELTGSDGGTQLRTGASAHADVRLVLEPEVLYRLASGRITAAGAVRQIEIVGDRKIADGVISMLAGAAA